MGGTPSRRPPRTSRPPPPHHRLHETPRHHHPREENHDEAERREYEKQWKRDETKQESERKRVERGGTLSRTLGRWRLGEFRFLFEQPDRIFPKILPVPGTRAAHHLREAPREVFDFGVELALSLLDGVRRRPIIRQNPSRSRTCRGTLSNEDARGNGTGGPPASRDAGARPQRSDYADVRAPCRAPRSRRRRSSRRSAGRPTSGSAR